MLSHCSAGEEWKLLSISICCCNVWACAIILFRHLLQFLHFFFPFHPHVVIIICIYLFTLHLCLSYLPFPCILLNELLPSSHTSLFLVSLPFHFSGSFFFKFFIISLFHSYSYSFSFISSFIIIFFAALHSFFPPLIHFLSSFYFLFSVLLFSSSALPPLIHFLSSIFYSPCYYCSSALA